MQLVLKDRQAFRKSLNLYIYWSFGIIWFLSICFENRVLEDVSSVAHIIAGPESASISPLLPKDLTDQNLLVHSVHVHVCVTGL